MKIQIANRTYVEEQTELQRTIFSKYNKRKRPVKNSSEPLDVAIHVYLMHLSVNQIEQTVTLNGHIYMVSF
uniref:Neurotransmitter-gated ion-channel ligand-binding domain-containing protein n=1 Tax=Parascaris equorum TaxID=6256 RepID=A0A914S490_PAREQ